MFVYNAGFENRIMRGTGQTLPGSTQIAWKSIIDRVVDLLPIARNRYYHPSQYGSWSIKVVLPAVCPELCYDQLDGVQDGGMAVETFKEAIAEGTNPERKQEIERQLLEYCKLDTYAMVRLWQVFSDRNSQ